MGEPWARLTVGTQRSCMVRRQCIGDRPSGRAAGNREDLEGQRLHDADVARLQRSAGEPSVAELYPHGPRAFYVIGRVGSDAYDRGRALVYGRLPGGRVLEVCNCLVSLARPLVQDHVHEGLRALRRVVPSLIRRVHDSAIHVVAWRLAVAGDSGIQRECCILPLRLRRCPLCPSGRLGADRLREISHRGSGLREAAHGPLRGAGFVGRADLGHQNIGHRDVAFSALLPPGRGSRPAGRRRPCGAARVGHGASHVAVGGGVARTPHNLAPLRVPRAADQRDREAVAAGGSTQG
mmetsp:Transcript_4711/g.17792  ORF Transcript_4711/g.17792 Transcript_4711/m.17792 type:complete len:293 (-) Transcript_4711:1729-2607(-)